MSLLISPEYDTNALEKQNIRISKLHLILNLQLTQKNVGVIFHTVFPFLISPPLFLHNTSATLKQNLSRYVLLVFRNVDMEFLK